MRNVVKPILAVLAALAVQGVIAAPPTVTSQAALLDRIQIEDLIVSYYSHLGRNDAEAFGDYYTDDAKFDVNGIVGQGRQGIADVYRRIAGGGGPGGGGTFHMVLSNPLIQVIGNTATAQFLWTGINNDTVKAPPRLVEQGREYDTLVKQGGAWRISKRVVIADSGMPAVYDKTYTPRKDYDPAKDR